MAPIKWEYTVSIVFAICSFILLIVMFIQTQSRENYQDQLFREIESVASAGFILQDIPDSPLVDSNLEDYADMVERPLFFNQRRPINYSDATSEESSGEGKALEDLTISLIGIINTPDIVYALFHNPRAKPDESKFQRFKQGDNINGRLLKEIRPDRVIVSSDSGVEEIKLAKPRVQTAARHKKPHRPNPFSRKIKKK